jgi:hypothetical protein
MTKFADQLFDDLMREHGSALSGTRPPASRGPIATRRALLAVGGGGVAVAAAAGVLVATAGVGSSGSGGQAAAGKTPAYAVTSNPNGTVTLAVYRKDGIAGANAKLHELGDRQVYVVPVGAGCPSLSSLPAPAQPLNGKHLSVQSSVTVGASPGGSVTVNAKGIPAGDILVVAVETTKTGNTTTSLGAGKLTTAPAPSCVSLPSSGGGDFGFGSTTSGPAVNSGHGTGKSVSAKG